MATALASMAVNRSLLREQIVVGYPQKAGEKKLKNINIERRFHNR